MTSRSPVVPIDPLEQRSESRQPNMQTSNTQIHRPMSSTSSLNGFFEAVQQRHSLDATQIKEEAQGPTSVSLYSPWAHLYSHPGSVGSFPFPSPGFGFNFADGFAMGEYGGGSATTPTPGAAGMGSCSEVNDVKPVFYSADQYSSMEPNMRNAPSHRSSVVEDLKRSDRNASVASSSHSGPGSVSRVDSSSSGASMASAQCGDVGAGPEPDARTPTPLRLREASQSYNAFSSYFMYPRTGDDQATHVLQISQLPQMGQTISVSTNQLFHLTQPFQPSFNQNQYMSVPPALTQYPSQQSTQGIMSQDRQNSRGSTSSEVSSISPAMLRFQMPHIGSPLSMEADEQLQAISASTSPRSQVPLDLPVQSMIGMKKRESHSSMHTDMEDEGDDADDADGVEKNGMMWGMPTEAYRSLSARERKRVRNRISARTFRARRKEHLSVLEQDLADRNCLLKASQGQIKQLREENAELRRRLARFEPVG